MFGLNFAFTCMYIYQIGVDVDPLMLKIIQVKKLKWVYSDNQNITKSISTWSTIVLCAADKPTSFISSLYLHKPGRYIHGFKIV